MKAIQPDSSHCHEVQVHYKRPLYGTLQKICSSEDTEKVLRGFIDPERIDLKEFFWVILLNNANHVLGISEIGVGCTAGVVVNNKEVCQLALLCNASAIILAHNHPSGKLEASQQDRLITQKIRSILDILDITLLDHLILTSEGYYSFCDKNLL
jgi:DNA repair protein RadC